MRNILDEAGIDPGRKRSQGTWSDFLTRHAKTLWACDFLTVKTWTTKGVVDLFVLFYIHQDSRKVFSAVSVRTPDAKWMQQQARNATFLMEERGHQVKYLLRDLVSGRCRGRPNGTSPSFAAHDTTVSVAPRPSIDRKDPESKPILADRTRA